MTRAGSMSGVRDRWLPVVLLSLICFLVIGGTLTSLPVYLAAIRADLAVESADVDGMATALLLAMSISNLIVGSVIAKIHPASLVRLGILLAGAGWILAGNADTSLALSAAMAITGVGIGAATFVPAIFIITSLFAERRATAIALLIGSCVVASSVLPLLSDALMATYGWRHSFAISGLAISALCFLLGLGIGSPSVRTTASNDGSGGDDRRAAHFLFTLSFSLLVVALTLAQLNTNGVLFSVIPFLTEEGLTQSHAVLVYSAANLAGLPGLFIAGGIADRLGAKWPLILALLMQAMGTATLLVMAHRPQFEVFGPLGFILLWGSAGGLPAQLGPVLLADLVNPRAFGLALGGSTAIVGLAGAIAPMITGILYDQDWGYALALFTYAAVPVLASLCVVAINRPFQAARERASTPLTSPRPLQERP